MVVHSILKLLAIEAAKPYTRGIILHARKADRLIDVEIVLFLLNGQLVSDPIDVGSCLPPHYKKKGLQGRQKSSLNHPLSSLLRFTDDTVVAKCRRYRPVPDTQ